MCLRCGWGCMRGRGLEPADPGGPLEKGLAEIIGAAWLKGVRQGLIVWVGIKYGLGWGLGQGV